MRCPVKCIVRSYVLERIARRYRKSTVPRISSLEMTPKLRESFPRLSPSPSIHHPLASRRTARLTIKIPGRPSHSTTTTEPGRGPAPQRTNRRSPLARVGSIEEPETTTRPRPLRRRGGMPGEGSGLDGTVRLMEGSLTLTSTIFIQVLFSYTYHY